MKNGFYFLKSERSLYRTVVQHLEGRWYCLNEEGPVTLEELDPFSYLKDQLGETCMDIIVPKSKAVAGSVLSAESRWWQGSFNPTKQSVTRIKRVYVCQK